MSETECSIEDILPPVVLAHVFSYVEVLTDFLSISRVNKRWRGVIKSGHCEILYRVVYDLVHPLKGWAVLPKLFWPFVRQLRVMDIKPDWIEMKFKRNIPFTDFLFAALKLITATCKNIISLEIFMLWEPMITFLLYMKDGGHLSSLENLTIRVTDLFIHLKIIDILSEFHNIKILHIDGLSELALSPFYNTYKVINLQSCHSLASLRVSWYILLAMLHSGNAFPALKELHVYKNHKINLDIRELWDLISAKLSRGQLNVFSVAGFNTDLIIPLLGIANPVIAVGGTMVIEKCVDGSILPDLSQTVGKLSEAVTTLTFNGCSFKNMAWLVNLFVNLTDLNLYHCSLFVTFLKVLPTLKCLKSLDVTLCRPAPQEESLCTPISIANSVSTIECVFWQNSCMFSDAFDLTTILEELIIAASKNCLREVCFWHGMPRHCVDLCKIVNQIIAFKC